MNSVGLFFVCVFLFCAQNALAALERRYPPVSSCDTIILDLNYQQIKSIHGNDRPFIADAEIIWLQKPVRNTTLTASNGHSVTIQFTADGRSIIQQQAVRGCTAAVSAMLIRDNGGKVSVKSLDSRNLGNFSMMSSDIQAAGLEPLSSRLPNDGKMGKLGELIALNGPAIVGVSGEIGGHVVIVDALDFAQKLAAIRDPYHGWAIIIPMRSLEQRMGPGAEHEILQIKAPAPSSQPPAKKTSWWRRILY